MDKWVLKWVREKFGWRKKKKKMGKEDFYEGIKFYPKDTKLGAI